LILRSIKIFGFVLLTFVGLIYLYLLFSLIFSVIPTNANIEREKTVTIFVITNGVHTDFVLPIRCESMDWSRKVPFRNTVAKDSVMKYVAFGWGDKGFFLDTPNWSDLKFSTAFNAAFGLGESAMHVTYYKSVKESKNTFKIEMSNRQYLQLVNYIEDSFDMAENGEFINIKTDMVYGVNDAFYEGKGSYSLFHTCNTWTNSGLKECEQKACLWTPMDKGIFYVYRDKVSHI
jgi:uncharacterized protein (TIGR02117 family)